MIQILIAILAGIVTVAAPCILPLLPIILGTSIGQRSRTRPLFIVLGFVLVFSIAGVILSYLTRHTGLSANTVRTIAIIVLALFGTAMVWSKPFELLTVRLNGLMNRASAVGQSAGTGNLGGLVLGMTLGLVWTPCAGPVLGSILALVASEKDLTAAGILLAAYAIGAGVPMLVIAFGGQYITSRVRAIARYATVIQMIFGVIIIGLAVAMYYNYDTLLYQVVTHYFPSLTIQL
jgi:cytochrome c-type biogenesis protein